MKEVARLIGVFMLLFRFKNVKTQSVSKIWLVIKTGDRNPVFF
jgi:hypothetical protein